ncbi:MAG: hypothetical protein A2Y40_10265 [Candidatus Margulisbacteria bacterium GWF2_35_9]|nr:MAG: hypothetical protein A2Y40_10265 [Candidatus Margulisbacteria bacterium GWF2_35_9]
MMDIDYIGNQLQLVEVYSTRCHEYAVFSDTSKHLIILDLASIRYINNNRVEYCVVSPEEITKHRIIDPKNSLINASNTI